LRFKASLGKEFMRHYVKKNPSQKRAGGVAQGIGFKFKPQYHKKEKKLLVNTVKMFLRVGRRMRENG
jgi:hypothetical protein